MSTTDPNVIEINNKSGVSVGGHVLRGVTRWSARHDYDRGLFEVQLTLVTSSFKADLGPGSNGMFTFYDRKSPAETQLSAACGATGMIGISKSVPRPDGSVETTHFGTGGA